MPSFWDSIKSVGAGAASTAQNVFSNTLGTLRGAAEQKIQTASNQVQSKVAQAVTRTQDTTKPLPATDTAKAPAVNKNGAGALALIAGAALVFFMMRKSNG